MNKYIINKFSDLVISSMTSVFVVLILLSSAVMAEDTEIYFSGGAGSDSVVRPNVLLVLDTSGSMSSRDGTGVTRLDRMKTALHTIINGANNVNMGLMRFHGEGGPVLYPVANLDAATTEVEGAADVEPISLVFSKIDRSEDDAQESVDDASVDLTSEKLTLIELPPPDDTTLEISVVDNRDDAEEKEAGNIIRYSTDLEMVDESGNQQTIGIRFQNVNIPADATITSAEIEFRIDEEESRSTDLRIAAQKSLNPSQFDYDTRNISKRLSNATAAVSWDNLPDLDWNDKLISTDISSIIQELIDQPGWTGVGHPMTFIITGSGRRTVATYDDNQAQPLLRITYSTGGADKQLVGLRFKDVGVPQGATITDAYIEYVAAASGSDATSLVVTAENVDDSTASFTSVAGNLSTRAANATSSSVDWNDVESWTAGEHYLTPDLKTIVQDVVNRSGWCGNNAMAFFIQGGTGLREAESYDGDDPINAPVLHINYDADSVADGACINQTFQTQVATGSHDVEQESDGYMYSTSSDLELTNDGGNQTIGLRFTNVKIPQGTTILEAYLDFTSKDSQSGATSLTIAAEKSADAGTFTSASYNLSTASRPRTSATVSWSPGAWSTGGTYATPDLKSIIQEIVNEGAWDGGNALNMIITGTGLRRAWSSNGSPADAPVLRVKVSGDLSSGFKNVRNRLNDLVSELNYKGGTPIVDTLYEAALYYRGDDVFYGKTRGNSHSGNSLGSDSRFTRISHPASYTGGAVDRDASCTDDNLNSSSCVTEEITGSATYDSPITLECQKNYMILLSDGEPTRNTSVSRAETMIGSSCSGSGDGKCGPDIASFLKNNDQNDSIDQDQTIDTYTIGFNILQEGKTYLQSIANVGGGNYQDAGSAASLVTAFENIIRDILDRPTSFASPSLSINAFTRLNHNNDIYFSLFAPDRNRAWNGNVKKYTICSGTEVDGDGDASCKAGEILDANDNKAIGTNNLISESARSIWSTATDGPVIKEGGAGSNIPPYRSRNLYTYTGSSAPSAVSLSSSAHAVNTSNTVLAGLVGNNLFSHASPYNSAETDEINDLIEWMRGKDIKDEDDDDEDDENRHVFSDALHSSAVAVSYGYPVDGDGNPSDGADADDTPDFVTKLLVATNDGSLRMINAHNGIEEWAFIPQALLEQQVDLMNNINGDHIYGLDTTPTLRVYDANGNGSIEPAGTDIDGNGSVSDNEKDFIHAYVAMRRGGRNIYAFDITPATKLTDRATTNSISPKLLWRIEGGSGDFSALGESWSRPLPTSINYNGAKKDVLIFAGGYHTSQDDEFGVAAFGNAIYIVDADDGSRLWWANSDAAADLTLSDMTYAIPSDIAIIDANSDGLTERLYVGDTGGQLWRIDLASTLNASTAARLATVSSGSDDADKRKFFYPPDVAQMNDSVFSNTNLYDLVTINSGNRSHPLNKSVHDVLYSFRDPYVYSAMPADFTPITTSEMLDVTDIQIEAGTDEAVSLRSKKGWYINLQERDDAWIGEKGLGSPLIVAGKIFFTTYVPNETDTDDICKPAVEGNGRLYAINLLNGAAVYDHFHTTDPDAEPDLEVQDRRFNLSGGIPSSPGLWIPEGGKHTFVVTGTGGSAVVFDTEDGLLRERTFWQQQNIK